MPDDASSHVDSQEARRLARAFTFARLHVAQAQEVRRLRRARSLRLALAAATLVGLVLLGTVSR